MDNYEDILDRKTTVLLKMVKICAKIKADVVDKDEKEGGLRKILNLGHTFAHGIEKLCHISHGKAVVIGMNMAFKLSLENNLIEEEYYKQFLSLCEKFNLPITFEYENVSEIFNIMKDRYGLYLTPSGGEIGEKLLRVGHIGDLTIEDNIDLINKLKEVLV